MSETKLTEAQREELLRHSENPSPSAFRSSEWREALRPVVAAKLWVRGLLDRHQQSEHFRGERRTYWYEYKVTDAGRAALSRATSGE